MDEIDLQAEREGRAISMRKSYTSHRPNARRSIRQDVRRADKDDLIAQIKWVEQNVQT